MSLNIKNKETHRLVVRLAKATGESMTEAVTKAVQERLDRVQSSHEGRLERLRAISKDCARRLKEPYRSIDHADLLYDDKGLPR